MINNLRRKSVIGGGPASLAEDHLPPQQRWDRRYANLPADARTKPTPFVADILPRLPTAGQALDVAAGAGRHAIALAWHGLRVDAVDISVQGLQLARRRALAAGLESGRHIRFMAADLERPWLPAGQYDVILVSFFLHRPLFPLLKACLSPGGWLAYETFTTNQKITPNNQPIRRELLLRPGELRQAFSDLEILSYTEDEHNDRATARLLARKPASIGT
ncbi:MAG: class I SAM-dependent methyltransferase [Chloroflexota bacterium]